VRVSFLKIERFRGWHHLELSPGAHVLLSGVPRGGRSDVIEALGRVLSLDVFRRGVTPSDLW
jgi:MoxR-like ATPase